MPKNKIAYYTQGGKVTTTSIIGNIPAVTIFTPGTNGSRISMIQTLGFTGAGTVSLIVNDGTTDHTVYTKSTVVADVLDDTLFPKGANLMKYFNLEPGYTLKMFSTVSFNVCVYAENY